MANVKESDKIRGAAELKLTTERKLAPVNNLLINVKTTFDGLD